MSKPFMEVYKGELSAKASSNIALIKYWGKYPQQIPANPSISYTLTHSYTETKIEYESVGYFELEFWFEGEKKEEFGNRIQKYLQSIKEYVPFISSMKLKIESQNTFPHSSGIASSASAFAALSLGLMKMESEIENKPFIDLQKASFLARLGSGSACRSIYPGLVEWGKTDLIEGSNDEYAISYPYSVSDDFLNFNDSIAIIHEGVKSVSSSVGHSLMKNHPFAEKRFQQANENLARLQQAMKENDLMSFGEVIENEALSLHAMMMTSTPSFLLMQPNTLEVINRIRNFRKQTSLPVFFTLDAGANVHILYPKKISSTIKDFIKEEIKPFCADGRVIEDEVSLTPTY